MDARIRTASRVTSPSSDGPMKALTDKLRDGADLNGNDVRYAVSLLLADSIDAAAKGDFLTVWHEKGETVDEITNLVCDLMERAVDPMLDLGKSGRLVIDVCGTGGDGFDLFNVSTAVMFVLAAADLAVVKHGNRSVTSRSGSADVLEALGVTIELNPDDLKRCVDDLGFGFIYARRYHPAFRALAEMRRQLARQNKRTVFNIVGPLLNPVSPPYQLIGVYNPRLTNLFAQVLRELGCKRAWVVHGLVEGDRGVDDVSTMGPTTVAELHEGKVKSAVLDTRWLGIPPATIAELTGGDAVENAKTIESILSGDDRGAKYNYVVANAAAALVVAEIARDMNSGAALAREFIDSGGALKKLRALQAFKASGS